MFSSALALAQQFCSAPAPHVTLPTHPLLTRAVAAMDHEKITMTPFLEAQERTMVLYGFSRQNMAVNALVTSRTKIGKFKIQGSTINDYRGGVFEHKPLKWKPSPRQKRTTIEPLEEVLKATPYYRAKARPKVNIEKHKSQEFTKFNTEAAVHD